MSLTPNTPRISTAITGLATLSVVAVGCYGGHDPSTVAAGALAGALAATAFLNTLGLPTPLPTA